MKDIFVRYNLIIIVSVICVMLTACSNSDRIQDTEVNVSAIQDDYIESDVGAKSNKLPEKKEDNVESAVDINNNETVEEKHESIRIVMVGDILLHTRVSESAHLQDGSYDYNPLFAHTKELISGADLALVNQEVIIGGEELGVSGYPSFNAPYAIGDALVDNGFDMVLHATNHAVDKGKRGLHNCLEYWKETHPEIEVLGIHDSEEDQQSISYVEMNGIKVAFLNYTYGTNGIALPSDMPWSVDLLQEDRVIADLLEAEANADFTVVCPHWGTEYNIGISKEQEKWTKIFVSNGADLIIGTHPHVIEPIEWYTDEETNNKALVYYSIGNYVNWTSGEGAGTANRMVGGMADITISREDDEVIISDHTVHALLSHLEEGVGNVTTYLLKDYTEALSCDNMIRKQDSRFSYDYCIELCDKVWDSWE